MNLVSLLSENFARLRNETEKHISKTLSISKVVTLSNTNDVAAVHNFITAFWEDGNDRVRIILEKNSSSSSSPSFPSPTRYPTPTPTTLPVPRAILKRGTPLPTILSLSPSPPPSPPPPPPSSPPSAPPPTSSSSSPFVKNDHEVDDDGGDGITNVVFTGQPKVTPIANYRDEGMVDDDDDDNDDYDEEATKPRD